MIHAFRVEDGRLFGHSEVEEDPDLKEQKPAYSNDPRYGFFNRVGTLTSVLSFFLLV